MDSFALIIFGITSNLAQNKLLPALYDVCEKGLLPKDTSIVGIARKPKTHEDLISEIRGALEQGRKKGSIKEDVFLKLTKNFKYIDGNVEGYDLYQKIRTNLQHLSTHGLPTNNKIFYLATYPELYESILTNLKKSDLNKKTDGWTRLMIEKPIGNNLKRAKKLNKLLLKYFSEEQIYRLDHYLGKETLQNILTFRFNNGIFEHLMNKKHIDHIQITAAEDFGIGERGNYYDSVGALRDVGQNHLLQMLALATMNAPKKFTNQDITSQRIRLIRRLKPVTSSLVLGQYQGYKKDKFVKPNSKAETFFALKTFINNSRYKGVPIYLRAGKNLQRSVAEIAIVFKVGSNRILGHTTKGKEPNILYYRIQPNEGVVIKTLVKKPGHEVEVEPAFMQFCYKYLGVLTDPYEKLIVDVMKGDQTFFIDAPEIEAQWKFIDGFVKSKAKIHKYKAGTWGPKEADDMIIKDGKAWLEPSVQFCQF